MRTQAFDSPQAAFGFVESQTSHVEAQVYKIKFTSIQYLDLLGGCIETSANPWAKTVTYYSSEDFGGAKWFNGNANDIPYGEDERNKFETGIFSAARGYRYGLEEVNQAAMLGIPLDADRARGARRAFEEFVDNIALTGDTAKSWTGIYNNASVPTSAAAGTWSTATASNVILNDINDAITKVQTQTNTVSISDTLLLPYTKFNFLATNQLPNTTTTLLEFVRKNNVFTANTGKPLDIKSVRGLDTAGAGSAPRMVAYRKDPEVLKLHLPMPLRFMPVQIVGLEFRIPGMFRVGGLDIRLPKEMHYKDGF